MLMGERRTTTSWRWEIVLRLYRTILFRRVPSTSASTTTWLQILTSPSSSSRPRLSNGKKKAWRGAKTRCNSSRKRKYLGLFRSSHMTAEADSTSFTNHHQLLQTKYSTGTLKGKRDHHLLGHFPNMKANPLREGSATTPKEFLDPLLPTSDSSCLRIKQLPDSLSPRRPV